MLINYFCDALGQEDAATDVNAITRFPEIVARVSPGGTCTVAQLGRSLIDNILQAIANANSFPDLAATVADILCDVEQPRGLLICCSTESTIATLVKKSCPHCQWGANCDGLSVVYEHQPAAVWHEMFHLLGAEDCYVVKPNGHIQDFTCGNRRCIMQYAPEVQVVGDPPFVCEDNVRRICGSLVGK